MIQEGGSVRVDETQVAAGGRRGHLVIVEPVDGFVELHHHGKIDQRFGTRITRHGDLHPVQHAAIIVVDETGATRPVQAGIGGGGQVKEKLFRRPFVLGVAVDGDREGMGRYDRGEGQESAGGGIVGTRQCGIVGRAVIDRGVGGAADRNGEGGVGCAGVALGHHGIADGNGKALVLQPGQVNALLDGVMNHLYAGGIPQRRVERSDVDLAGARQGCHPSVVRDQVKLIAGLGDPTGILDAHAPGTVERQVAAHLEEIGAGWTDFPLIR